MKDDNLASTGTGNTGLHLGINGDRFMGNTLTSFAISYVIYSEGEFETEGANFKMKHGNELNAAARMSLKMSPKMSIGVEGAYYDQPSMRSKGRKWMIPNPAASCSRPWPAFNSALQGIRFMSSAGTRSRFRV